MALTDGPVRNRLIELWAPMIGGVLAVKAIGVSDAYFIGQLGEQSLAAISFTFPVVMTLISLAIGLSSGASSVLSQAIGEAGDERDKRQIVAGALSISMAFSLAMGVVGILTVNPLFQLMGAEDEILVEIRRYMIFWFAGAPLLFIPIVINGILRATGDGVAPAILMAVVAVINIALNPIFIFGFGPIPALEIQGAAAATLLARFISFAAAMALLFRRELIAVAAAPWREGLAAWPEIMRIGGPAAVSTAMNPLAFSFATAAVATLGPGAVAGFGVATKIQSIALVPILALSAAAAPIAGQNSGAGETGRTRAALNWSFAIALGWTGLAAVFFWLLRDPLTAAFTDSDEAQKAASLFLLIVPISFAGYGAVIVVSAAFNGLGRSLTALTLAGGRAQGLLAPGAWIGAMAGGFAGVAAAIASANLLSGVAAYILATRHELTTRKNGKRGESASSEDSE